MMCVLSFQFSVFLTAKECFHQSREMMMKEESVIISAVVNIFRETFFPTSGVLADNNSSFFSFTVDCGLRHACARKKKTLKNFII